MERPWHSAHIRRATPLPDSRFCQVLLRQNRRGSVAAVAICLNIFPVRAVQIGVDTYTPSFDDLLRIRVRTAGIVQVGLAAASHRSIIARRPSSPSRTNRARIVFHGCVGTFVSLSDRDAACVCGLGRSSCWLMSAVSATSARSGFTASTKSPRSSSSWCVCVVAC